MLFVAYCCYFAVFCPCFHGWTLNCFICSSSAPNGTKVRAIKSWVHSHQNDQRQLETRNKMLFNETLHSVPLLCCTCHLYLSSIGLHLVEINQIYLLAFSKCNFTREKKRTLYSWTAQLEWLNRFFGLSSDYILTKYKSLTRNRNKYLKKPK